MAIMCFFLSLGQPLINRQLQWESKRKQKTSSSLQTMLDLYRRRHNFDQNNNSPYRGIRKAKVSEIGPFHVDKIPGKTPQILVDAAQRGGADTRAHRCLLLSCFCFFLFPRRLAGSESMHSDEINNSRPS
jgi:hypothetical protein